MENILWLVIFRFLQRISRRLCWIGFGGSYELQLHNIVKVHLQQISDINWTSDSSPSPSSFSQSSSWYCQGSSPTNCQNQTHHHHKNCQVFAPPNCHHLLIILTRRHGYWCLYHNLVEYYQIVKVVIDAWFDKTRNLAGELLACGEIFSLARCDFCRNIFCQHQSQSL